MFTKGIFSTSLDYKIEYLNWFDFQILISCFYFTILIWKIFVTKLMIADSVVHSFIFNILLIKIYFNVFLRFILMCCLLSDWFFNFFNKLPSFLIIFSFFFKFRKFLEKSISFIFSFLIWNWFWLIVESAFSFFWQIFIFNL